MSATNRKREQKQKVRKEKAQLKQVRRNTRRKPKEKS